MKCIIHMYSLRVTWAEHVICLEAIRNTYTILIRKAEEKRPLGRPRYRWEDNIKTYLKETGCKGEECIHLSQDRTQC